MNLPVEGDRMGALTNALPAVEGDRRWALTNAQYTHRFFNQGYKDFSLNLGFHVQLAVFLFVDQLKNTNLIIVCRLWLDFWYFQKKDAFPTFYRPHVPEHTVVISGAHDGPFTKGAVTVFGASIISVNGPFVLGDQRTDPVCALLQCLWSELLSCTQSFLYHLFMRVWIVALTKRIIKNESSYIKVYNT